MIFNRILVVEDSKIDYMALDRMFRKVKVEFDYVHASSVTAATSILIADNQFDLLLLDYSLADGTAFDLMGFHTIPIVVMTSHGDESIAVKAMKRGAADYIVKDQEQVYLELIPFIVQRTIAKKNVERQLEAVQAERNLVSVARFDLNGRVLSCNETFASTLGFPSVASVEELEWSDLLITDLAEIDALLQKQAILTATELVFRGFDHKAKYGLANLARIQSLETYEDHIYITVIDVTTQREAEEALRISEKRYRQMFELIRLPMLVVNPIQGNILDANPAAVDYYGYALDQLKAMTVMHLNLAPPDDAAEKMEKVMAGEISTCNFRQRLADGTIRQVEVYAGRIQYDNTRQVVYTVYVDVTDRNQAELKLKELNRTLEQRVDQRTDELQRSEQALRESQNMLQLVLDTIPVGVFWKDRELALQGANDQYLSDAGFDDITEVVGKRSEDIFAQNIDDDSAIDRAVIESGESHLNYLESRLTTDGDVVWVETSKIPLRSDNLEVIGLLGVYTDVTAKKKAEEQLRLALETEQELNRLKSHMVSVASHEFRTPLAAMLAKVETLRAYRGRLSEEKIDKRLEDVISQVKHMKGITQDMLQFSRLQSGTGQFRPEQGDLQKFCREILREFEEQTDYVNRINYESDFERFVYSFDHMLMNQIMNNLIHNALKYSASETMVNVSLYKEQDKVVFRVEDQGIGIPEADLKHLFEPFHRAHNVGAIGGTGLGLSIAQKGVEIHGGEILVESECDVGTTFTVRLPAETLSGA